MRGRASLLMARRGFPCRRVQDPGVSPCAVELGSGAPPSPQARPQESWATLAPSQKAQYSCMPNEEGGIVDDLLIYCIEENKVYMIVVNASNIEKDWNWI